MRVGGWKCLGASMCVCALVCVIWRGVCLHLCAFCFNTNSILWGLGGCLLLLLLLLLFLHQKCAIRVLIDFIP